MSQYHHCGRPLHLRPPDDAPPLVMALWCSRHMSQVSGVTLVALSDHFPVKPLLSLLGPSQPGRPERASSPLATSSHHGVISCQERRHIHSDGCPHSVLSAVDLLLPMTSYYCQRIGCHTTQGPSHNVSLTREMRQRLSCGSRFIALCYMMSPLHCDHLSRAPLSRSTHLTL